MNNYSKLVTKLRDVYRAYVVTGNEKAGQFLADAAAAIEELDSEETRLLLITSELQDKVVELEEWLNDDDVAADDNARQIEELAKRNAELHAELERWVSAAEKAGEPKRGEWELIDGVEPMRWGCSRCKYLSWETSNYCPRCGAKMEVQDADK